MNTFTRTYNFIWRKGRIRHYNVLSTNRFSGTSPDLLQPVLFKGCGKIHFDGKCTFGWISSPGFYNTYTYLEAREKGSRIIFGGGSIFNNNFQVIADTGEIRLGSNLRVGVNCIIINSDFHNLDFRTRDIRPFPSGDVVIGDNVFIGNNVSVLKGVTIGSNSVIGSGSVVSLDIPANTLAAGSPARIVKNIGI
jgi:acetyltransferase-like isoleucine patch superfamily enzyme